ncbi:Bidirectional sugar transporter SWEET4 [Hibiscus syriacus]|uniref:Bidirectional sugar transporter SWEET n=1 Tax=Hibiscus syriacus TaxID=106335 RepID=A0A6A3CYN4_HIBSY|nr:bidirectional sugar transporter SWEET7-like [Hibiscus syriacus]KAE8732209.1 Bidirectional sugar transporter SWEET4 [Hibiscus syriacus]
MVSHLVTTSRNIVGIAGNFISLFLFLSPLPTFVRIWKKGSVEQFSPVPYLATLINCMVWVVYGLPMVHPNSSLVVTINGTGTAIELAYLTLFLIFCHDKKKRLKVVLIVLLELIFVAALTALVLIVAHNTRRRSLVVGIMAILFNIMMYAAPLSVMKLVITTKSVEYMPFFLSVGSFANGVAWTTYAFLPFDPFIAASNGLGTLFSLAQLLLYATYYKSTKRIIAARQGAKMEMNLSEVVFNGDNNDPKKTSTAP